MSAIAAIKLRDLVKGLPGVSLQGDGRAAISGIAYDSRKVRPGDLFVAVPGTKVDGAAFIAKAVAAGAAAVLAVSAPASLSVPAATTPEVRLTMGRLAGRLYNHPDHRLGLAGITGTNGKTTITYLLESILKAAGKVPGVIGTVNYRVGELSWPSDNTTPESADVLRILSAMEEQGATHAIMEASSHALDQKRVSGLHLRRGLFTNLSRDHLDYHHDFESYYQAKKLLFTEVITGKWEADRPARALSPLAIVNLDDEYGARLAKELAGEGVEVLGFGINSPSADARAMNLALTDQGSRAELIIRDARFNVASSLLGRHNVENILAAAALAISIGVPPAAIIEGTRKLASVPGRLQPVPNRAGITVLVDYAHTPDALQHAVDACRGLAARRLITVFGCGGDRDRGKRSQMGGIAVTGSDLAVITSDNPRTEDPNAIIAEILAGVKSAGAGETSAASAREPAPLDQGQSVNPSSSRPGQYLVEPDRKKAIALAIGLAQPGDIVLIAGKGHENYQILGATKVHFDDREEAERALKERT
jgi:UDP-N-acetylmuramoyl-L-alanyl-D-glutamate--2,6-diaminopimelate ligase